MISQSELGLTSKYVLTKGICLWVVSSDETVWKINAMIIVTKIIMVISIITILWKWAENVQEVMTPQLE